VTAVVTETEFREALKNFPGGVTVVTAYDKDGHPTGATVSAFTSLSLTPPLILVCLNSNSRSIAGIRQRRGFVVHFLAEDQVDVARRFASDVPDKFQGLGYKLTPDGVPYLEDCPARLECILLSEYPGGDHVILVGEVKSAYGEDEYRPLLYARRNFHTLGEVVGFAQAGAS
jgi:flavin reductase (DIM6/NTAB) family NADH-FMN oxidoreductase RutF